MSGSSLPDISGESYPRPETKWRVGREMSRAQAYWRMVDQETIDAEQLIVDKNIATLHGNWEIHVCGPLNRPSNPLPAPETSTQFFDRLPDEVIESIMFHGMVRDPPYFLGFKKPEDVDWDTPAGTFGLIRPRHEQSLQLDHRRDWFVASTISHRLRQIGRPAFFKAKIFAMENSLPRRLASDNGRLTLPNPDDRAMALQYISEVVIVDSTAAASWYWWLPPALNLFPSLDHCTLLAQWSDLTNCDPEWVTSIVAERPGLQDRRISCLRLKELLVALGLRQGVELDMFAGPWSAACGYEGQNWLPVTEDRTDLERHCFRILTKCVRLRQQQGLTGLPKVGQNTPEITELLFMFPEYV